MAIKSNIIDAPLKGEINLSKNKLDVVSPQEGGYIKNNGVLYGNVLSPVYRQSGQTAFDYLDDSKNHYTITTTSLNKNGNSILSFLAKQFNKEEIQDLTNVDSLYDKTHYIQVYSNRAVIKRGLETTTEYGTIYATKMIDAETAVLFYSNQQNEYYIKLFYKHNDTYSSTYQQINLGGFDLNAPIITSHTYTYSNEDYVCISIITDSGLSLKSHTTFLYAYKKSDMSLKSLGLYSSSGSQQTDKKIEKYLLTAQYAANDFSEVDATVVPASRVNTQQLWFRGESKSPTLQVKLYWQNTGTKTAEQAWATNIDTTASTAYSVNLVGSDWDGISHKETNLWHHVDANNLASNQNVKGFLWIALDSVVEWKEEYSQTEIDEAVNAVVKFKFLPTATGSVSNAPYKTETLTFPDTYVKYDSNIGGMSVAQEETAIISSTSQNCDAILDDGTLIQTQSPFVNNDAVFEQGLFNFTGHFDSISLVSGAYKLYYTLTQSEAILLGQANSSANHKYPYKLIGSSVSLDNNFYRSNIVAEGYPYLEEDEEKKDITSFLFDSGWDNYRSQVLMQAGYESNDNSIKAGSLVQIGKWRLLYNNNLLSGISYANDETSIGTLVTDWLSVSKILYVSENDIYYLNNRGLVQHIYVDDATEAKYTVIRDRFLVINTTSYENCWDLKYSTSLHWASDWNNRFFEGFAVPGQLKITASNTKTLEKMAVYDIVSMASAQNANYEMTLGRSISSAVFPPEILNNVSLVKKNILRGETTEAIDFYRADEGLVVIYDISYKNKIFYKDVNLEGALYPLSDTSSSSILFNPNIFTQFIRTYNNNDMAISDGTAYPLQKYNGDIIMLFLMTKGIESMQNIFVLQTLYYGIGDGKIWEIYYDNSTISNYQAIIDVKGMTYLGQLPTEALFWSPLNRSIYSFTGDAILKQLWHCNDISTINKTFYNPSTQELFISTDIGLLCISNSYTYLIDDMKDVEEMFFYNTEFYIKNIAIVEGSPVTQYYKASYEYFSGGNQHIKLTTKYIGSIENYKIHINCVYIRLYKNTNDTGTFKIKERTITDKSMATDFKQCTIDWDTEGWGYIRYQPQYQKGSSISFEIDSTAPIISISYGYTVLDEVGQIGRNNI